MRKIPEVMMWNKLAMPLAFVLILAGCQTSSANVEPIPRSNAPVAVCGSGEVMMQTTLWFSMHKAQGGDVSQREWQQFVERDVMPRFNSGVSLLEAQSPRLSGSKLTYENNKALILIHQPDRASSDSINTLRDIYKTRFGQKSVMRVDALVCVAF